MTCVFCIAMKTVHSAHTCTYYDSRKEPYYVVHVHVHVVVKFAIILTMAHQLLVYRERFVSSSVEDEILSALMPCSYALRLTLQMNVHSLNVEGSIRKLMLTPPNVHNNNIISSHNSYPVKPPGHRHPHTQMPW